MGQAFKRNDCSADVLGLPTELCLHETHLP